LSCFLLESEHRMAIAMMIITTSIHIYTME
jgi:hypothetical protein